MKLLKILLICRLLSSFASASYGTLRGTNQHAGHQDDYVETDYEVSCWVVFQFERRGEEISFSVFVQVF